MRKLPIILSIAGTDPSGGAGIHADLKTISATGGYAAAVVTALVAQNTCGVQAIHEIPATFVTKQLESVFNDLDINAVKIGMLHDIAIMECIVDILKKYRPQHVILDPVMVAKNGCNLLNPSSIDYLKKHVLPQATLITPNIPEAEQLLGQDITDLEIAAKSLAAQWNINVLLKGGHQQTKQSSDVLYTPINNQITWFHADRIITKNTHGTGCTLSSAIASYIAQGNTLPQAISMAKNYLTAAILSGSKQQIGHGCGPVDHFYFQSDRG
jgi:hydroxymethylpyrimidine/phosphomethylpyrimidine kinase